MSQYEAKLGSGYAGPRTHPEETAVKVIFCKDRKPFPCDTEKARLWVANRKQAGAMGKVISRIIIADNFCDPLVLHDDGTEALYDDSELENLTAWQDPNIENLKEFLNGDTIYHFKEMKETTKEIAEKLTKNFNIWQIARILSEYEHTRKRCKQLSVIYPFLDRVLQFEGPLAKLAKLEKNETA